MKKILLMLLCITIAGCKEPAPEIERPISVKYMVIGDTSSGQTRDLFGIVQSADKSDYREADKVIPIILKGEEELNNINKLKLIPLISDTGNIVPLEQVGDVEFFIQPGKVKRFNLQRTVTISAIHNTMPATEFHKQIIDTVINEVDIPYGYSIEYGGEIEDGGKANKALFQFMPHCFAFIILLMVWQFNSIKKMSVIILTIPLVVIGAALSLHITGAYLDFNGMLGLLSLAGIIVNNGIVLIDQIDRLLLETDDKRQAVIDACAARLRPILMTTLTTFLGLMPLIFFGGALWFAMGIIIAGGICVGTIFTLGFVPALYCVMFKVK
jgi:multidrug efflux pump